MPVLSLLFLFSSTQAHEVSVPSRADLVQELRNINQQLQLGSRHLERELSLSRSAIEQLSQAQIAFLEEDYSRAALDLLQLLSRPGIERSLSYAEALGYLGESLWQMGLHEAAAQHFRRALKQEGSLLSNYQRVLRRYLLLLGAQEPLSLIRSFWRRYQQLREGSTSDKEDQLIRYEFAKALFRGGALEEARSFFEGMKAGPHQLKARYFLAVLKLKKDDLKGAEKLFREALLELKGQESIPEPSLPELETAGPPRELIPLELPEEAILLDDEARQRLLMKASLELSLARLAASNKKDSSAWKHYRQVPRGTPDFSVALAEASFVLFRRGEYAWCVRLLDQLIAERGDDLSAAQLSLWKGQLLARAARYEEAQTHYELLEERLKRQSKRLELERNQERLFPPSVLAWSAPKEVQRARSLEAELLLQEELLDETQELLKLLQGLSQKELLPVVSEGRKLRQRLEAALQGFERRLLQAAQAAHREPDSGKHNGGPPADQDDIKQLQRSYARLQARLKRFDGRLERFQGRWRQQLSQIITAEAPQVQRLSAQLGVLRGDVQRLAQEMGSSARENLEEYAAEAFLGQVDLVWWRKQEITEKIKAAFQEKELAMRPFKQLQTELELLPDSQNSPKEPPTPDQLSEESDHQAERRSAPSGA